MGFIWENKGRSIEYLISNAGCCTCRHTYLGAYFDKCLNGSGFDFMSSVWSVEVAVRE